MMLSAKVGRTFQVTACSLLVVNRCAPLGGAWLITIACLQEG